MKNQTTQQKGIRLRPIGTAHKTDREDIMKIEVYPEYTQGLDGIENLDHIYVLYWMHKLDEKEREILKVHPKGDPDKPLTGVFALRSPARPNPIGLTRVKLVKKAGNTLLVEGLDALDGSPIIDIKSG
jgi:tRNA-Thr(GGU) m(6)t(6)A37 methyltransferase TsaA